MCATVGIAPTVDHICSYKTYTHTAEANGMIRSMTVLIIYINIYTYISKHDKHTFLFVSHSSIDL